MTYFPHLKTGNACQSDAFRIELKDLTNQEEDYQYAFVSGNSTSSLWLLARTPTVSSELVNRFIKRSKELGFDTEGLIFVEHD